MPTYDYKCQECGKSFSVVMMMSEHGTKKVACPKCSSKKVTQKVTGFAVKTGKKS